MKRGVNIKPNFLCRYKQWWDEKHLQQKVGNRSVLAPPRQVFVEKDVIPVQCEPVDGSILPAKSKAVFEERTDELMQVD